MSDRSLAPEYFDDMYAANADPWDFSGRWYERRKRDITVASLPRERFARVFEPGCSIGLLSLDLAQRSDALLAADVSLVAIEATRARLAGQPGVRVERRAVPEDWPDGPFDLIVLSEVAYYSSHRAAGELGRLASETLADDGYVVLCHWLHPVADYPLSGSVAQRVVREASRLDVVVAHQEADFLLEVLARPGTPSVAEVEGLIG
ncbi:MAG: nodulation S family protein [Actinomycetota bacterium]|nr:nodulation S family protein [Actinomycetota bacterium]